MPLVHIDGTGQITWIFQGNGISGEAAVTLGISTSNTDTQQVADKANRAMRNAMMPVISNGLALVVVHATLRIDGENEVADSFASLPMTGAESADDYPANVAVLVQKRTNFAGRKNRGRFYFPGLTVAQTNPSADPNALKPTALTEYQARVDVLYTELTDSSDGEALHPVILHPSPSTTVTSVVAFAVQGRLATQRGRLRD